MNRNSKLKTSASTAICLAETRQKRGEQNSKPKLKAKNFLIFFFRWIKTRKVENFLLFIILVFSAFFRLYKLDQLLGFWYDQGRDALVIWDLIHYKKFFLIGPVTGIEGIFLGPFFYYLLTPFYWLGKGNPVTVAAGLAWIDVGAVFLLYSLGKKMFNASIGLLTAFLYGFSYQQIVFSRWLANPNPLPFFTLLVLIVLYEFIHKHNSRLLILASFLIGLCLQLEAASAVFFLPSTMVVLIWQRKRVNFRILLWSFLAFLATLAPQIYFNFRHEGILVSAFRKFLIEEKSFRLSLFQVVSRRLLTYYDVFTSKLIPARGIFRLLILALFSAVVIFSRKKIFEKERKLLIIWLFVPAVGFFFYQGNHGYIWDYYFTGVIPALFLLFAASLYSLERKGLWGKVMVGTFLIIFTFLNGRSIKNYLKTGIGITLRAQKKAIDWIYHDAGEENFNVDVYVPPQIYFSYSYLFRWYGKQEYGREPDTKLVKNLYTLEEPDGEHPQFLKAWLERQDTIGKIKYDYFWGDITVQKRERVKYD